MDTPRLTPTGNMLQKKEAVDGKDVRTFTQIAMEHNREPGVFDYNHNQNFYSTFPEIDQEAYLVIGDKNSKGAHKSYANGKIMSPENKPF